MTDPAPAGASHGETAVDALPRRYLRLLGEAADRLLSAEDPSRMVDDLFALIADELRVDVFFNYRFERDELVLETHGGLDAAEAASFERLALGQAVCGCAARDQRPIKAFGVQTSRDPMADFVRALGIDAYVCTPLMHGTTLLGTLSFGRRWTDRFDADELAFIHVVCHYVALAKHRLRIEAELRDGIASRERLLAELNHRVRNALQTAVAVVRLGAADTQEPAAHRALAAAAARLEVLAAAHRPLYATDSPTRIDIAALLAAVAEHGDGDGVAIVGNATPTLPVEQAAAVAMLVQTLLVGDDAAPPTQLRITTRGDRVELAFRGTAVGIARPAVDDSRLVRGLTRQLRADLVRDGADTLALSLPATHD